MKKMKKTWEMKTWNWVLGGLLIALSILTSLADWFNWSCFELILIVTTILVGITTIVVTFQYHGYDEWHEYNPRKFWISYSIISAFVCFGIVVVSLNSNLLDPSLSYFMYLAFPVVPIVGVVGGMIWDVVDDVMVSLMYR